MARSKQQRNKKGATAPVLPPPQPAINPSPGITDLDEFQAAYGDEWIRIKNSPAFQAALGLLNARKNRFIETLSDDQIAAHGATILGDLRGHLNHEHDLATLDIQREPITQFDLAEEYISPEALVEIEQVKEKYREQLEKRRYAS